jgi:hypothetical protein
MNAMKIVELALTIFLGYWAAMIRSMARMLTLAILIGGCLLMLYFGGRSPEWMLRGEVLIVAIFALVYGFTAFSPSLPSWLRYQEVRGVLMVALGVFAMFVPAQFIVSALLIGFGARLVMTGFPSTALKHQPGDIVLRPAGNVVPRD